jgi:hypothetical protein
MADAARVVGGLRRGFTDCYNQELARDPCAAGKVALELRVDCTGEVHGVRARSAGLSQQAVSCLLEVAQQARFEATGALAVVQVPLLFARR